MSRQKVKNKIYALIVVVTLFASINNLSQAEEKSAIIENNEFADNKNNITENEGQDKKVSNKSTKKDNNFLVAQNQVKHNLKDGNNEFADNKNNIAKNEEQDKETSDELTEKENNLSTTQNQIKNNLKVGTIEISQLNEISPELIRSKIPVKTGDSYSNKSLSDIYLALRRLEYVKDVNVFPHIEGENVNITIEVSEAENAGTIIKKQQTLEELKRDKLYSIKCRHKRYKIA